MLRRDLLKLLPALALPSLLAGGSGARAAAGGDAFGVGMNLAGVTYWTSEHPFTNLATAASRWRLQDVGGPFSWDLPLPPMTDEGYPRLVEPGSFLESFLVFTPFRRHLSLNLVVQYDGSGRIDYLAGAELLRREKGRDIIRNLRNDQALTARLVKTSPDDPLRNLRVYEEGREGGETFRPAFLDRLSGMSVIRFMDWMNTNNSDVVSWDQRPRRDRFTQAEKGVAPEFMVELANRLKTPPWFTLPHRADAAFVRAFAEEVRRTLDPALDVYVEYSNEVWNSIFEQARYAYEQGARLGLSSNPYEAALRFYSQRTSEVLAIWEDVFGGESRRVVGVYAAQAVTPWTSEVILSWGDAADHADVLAVAPYFGGSLGDADKAETVSKWSMDELFASLADEVRHQNREFIRQQAEVADRFGVRLVAYEGGQHLVAHPGSPLAELVSKRFEEANRDARMGELYRDHLANWREAGGGIYALFNSMGPYSKWGSWGLLEHEGAEESSPKWAAVRKLVNS